MRAVDIAIGLAGVGGLGLVLWDVFQTIVVPRKLVNLVVG